MPILSKPETQGLKPYKVYLKYKLVHECETEALAHIKAQEISKESPWTVTVKYEIKETLAFYDNGINHMKCFQC